MRFYTLPPRSVVYPYVIVNAFNYRELYRRRFVHAILDVGVEKLFDHGCFQEYPAGFLKKYLNLCRKLSRHFEGKIWCAIPDYPDDYTHNHIPNNVEKTLRNIEEFISKDGVEWLPVIQSRYMDTFSFIDSAHRVKELIGSYPRVAIGTVCKARSLKWIRYCASYARTVFPRAWIHAFGLTLRALPHVKEYINSFDSTVWDTRKNYWKNIMKKWLTAKPLEARLSKTERERIAFFHAYLQRVQEVVG